MKSYIYHIYIYIYIYKYIYIYIYAYMHIYYLLIVTPISAPPQFISFEGYFFVILESLYSYW